MRYFYFMLAVYPHKITGLPIFENILEFEIDEPLNSANALERTSNYVNEFLREPGAIIHSFQLLRTEKDQTDADGVKIPDPTAWDNLPEWVNYKTMDKDGEIWVWEDEPIQRGTSDWFTDGRYKYIARIKNPHRYDWTKMIEARPAK